MKENLLLLKDLKLKLKSEEQIYKYISLVLKYVYIIKLDEIVNQCINTYHKAIKLEPANVKSSSHIDFGVENNDEDHKFEVGDHVRTSKYRNIFAKTYTPNWSEEEFIIKKKLKTLCFGRMLLVILMMKKFLEQFIKKSYKRRTKQSLK